MIYGFDKGTVIAAARLTFTLIACNVVQIATSKMAQRLKARGMGKLHQELNHPLGFSSQVNAP